MVVEDVVVEETAVVDEIEELATPSSETCEEDLSLLHAVKTTEEKIKISSSFVSFIFALTAVLTQ